ncbi:MAG: ABC transporter permease [Candidatus Omnitrophica bacterium]|nr:ABC transporter permease [Candidatus Omnitrophota bacterium]
MNQASAVASDPAAARCRSDAPFILCLWIIGGFYLFLIVAMLWAKMTFTSPGHLWSALQNPEIQYSIKLTLLSCTLTTLFSLWTAVPIGYLLSHYDFPGKNLLDSILDIPIVLPPLVVGLGLLILFRTSMGQWVEQYIGFTYAVPGVILAQFMVACAFAVRTMRTTFEQINPRREQVALTLGCSRAQAFWAVVLPETRRGLLTAATLAWARSMGEFGPLLVFAGATRMRTEVLSTSVFLELSVGNIEAAVAVSLLMVLSAVAVLLIVRLYGMDQPTEGMVKL